MTVLRKQARDLPYRQFCEKLKLVITSHKRYASRIILLNNLQAHQLVVPKSKIVFVGRENFSWAQRPEFFFNNSLILTL